MAVREFEGREFARSPLERLPFEMFGNLKLLVGWVCWPLLTLISSSCCTPAPPAQDYFDRATPMAALTMFQYSIHAKQYEAAWDTMTVGSQELIGSLFRFGFAVEHSIAELGDYSIRDIAIGGDRFFGGYGRAGEARVALMGEEAGQDIYLSEVDGDWLVDLPLTLEYMGVRVGGGSDPDAE